MFNRRGITLMDIIIIILIIGVIVVLIAPREELQREKTSEIQCQRQMKLLSEAEISYFARAGIMDTDSTVPDSGVQHIYTADIEQLRPFLPENIEGKSIDPDTISFACPLDKQKYIITIQDSLFFSISCPNGHGVVVNGSYSWE